MCGTHMYVYVKIICTEGGTCAGEGCCIRRDRAMAAREGAGERLLCITTFHHLKFINTIVGSQGPPGGFLSQSCSAIARRLMWHQHPTEGGWPSVVSPEVGGQLSEKLD